MDMLLLGETLPHASGATTRYEGFWMPAAGNEGFGAVETFLVSSADVFTVSVETKSSDETDGGGGVSVIGTATVDSTNPSMVKIELDNAKDLVRYVLECTSESDEYIHFQLCQPLWAPN